MDKEIVDKPLIDPNVSSYQKFFDNGEDKTAMRELGRSVNT